MADNTTLNVGTGGDVIITEQPGGVGAKIPVSKIYTGALDVNGGPVTPANPFDVRVSGADSTGAAQAVSVVQRNGLGELATRDAAAQNLLDTIAATMADVRDAVQNSLPIAVTNFPAPPAVQAIAGAVSVAGFLGTDSGLNETGAAQALSVSNRNGQAMLVVTNPDLLSQNDTIIQLLTDIRDAMQRLAPP